MIILTQGDLIKGMKMQKENWKFEWTFEYVADLKWSEVVASVLQDLCKILNIPSHDVCDVDLMRFEMIDIPFVVSMRDCKQYRVKAGFCDEKVCWDVSVTEIKQKESVQVEG